MRTVRVLGWPLMTPALVAFNSFQIVKPVPIVAKDFLPLIGTDNDVIKRPFEFYPWFPGHAAEDS